MPYHTHAKLVNMDSRVASRFWAKVLKTDGCWLWTAYVDPAGYGRLHVDGKSAYAHRLAFDGDIPEHLVVDHKCKVRRCVRRSHLQLVTRAENTRLGTKGKKKDFCVRGHDMNNPENVFTKTRKSGKRMGETYRGCVHCNRINAKSQTTHANIVVEIRSVTL